MPRKNSKPLPSKNEVAKIKKDLQEIRKIVLADSNTDVVRDAIDAYTKIINGMISKNIQLRKICKKHNIDPEFD